MRRRQQLEAAEARENARAWCCVVAVANIILITAYHLNAPAFITQSYQRWAAGAAAGPAPPVSAPLPLTGEALHRHRMGEDHHAAFHEQHGALHGAEGHDAAAQQRFLNSLGSVAAAATESSESPERMAATRLRELQSGGWAFDGDVFAAVQYRPDFVVRRSERPRPRDGMLAWIARCPAADGGDAPSSCAVGFVCGRSPAIVPPRFLVGFTLNGTTPLLYRYRAAGRKREKAAGPAPAAAAPSANASEAVGGVPLPPPATGASVAPRLVVTPKVLQAIYVEINAMAKKPQGHGVRGQFIAAVQHYVPFTKGKRVLVVGSLEMPVIEVAALTLGEAKHVTSLEHRPFDLRDRRMDCHTPEDFWRAQPNVARLVGGASSNASASTRDDKFDVAYSFSVLQHDGLGRYGDVVNPDGDLDAMNELWSLLSPGGLLLLAVPVGNDCVVFNTHRVYGRRRLPLLIRGWSVVEARGLPHDAHRVFENDGCDSRLTPTLVLRRTVPENATEELLRVPGLVGDFPVHDD